MTGKKVNYQDLRKSNFSINWNRNLIWIFHFGYTLLIEKTKDGRKITLDDELMAEPFSTKDIQQIRKLFPIIKSNITDTWQNLKDPPFHHHKLSFEIGKNINLVDLIKFVFEKIYKIDN